jgi:hypothetical protein
VEPLGEEVNGQRQDGQDRPLTSEKHPREVHEPAGHLDTLLKIIRLARRVCNACARPDDDLRTIEQRAENLSGLQLH